MLLLFKVAPWSERPPRKQTRRLTEIEKKEQLEQLDADPG
jgi:hypothetical protein